MRTQNGFLYWSSQYTNHALVKIRRPAGPRGTVAQGESPGISWGLSSAPCKGAGLGPYISGIVINLMLFQEGQQFLLKIELAMVLFLLFDVARDRRHIRSTDTEGGIAGLLGEVLAVAFMDPTRGPGLDLAQGGGDRNAWRQFRQDVDMIGHSIDP